MKKIKEINIKEIENWMDKKMITYKEGWTILAKKINELTELVNLLIDNKK